MGYKEINACLRTRSAGACFPAIVYSIRHLATMPKIASPIASALRSPLARLRSSQIMRWNTGLQSNARRQGVVTGEQCGIPGDETLAFSSSARSWQGLHPHWVARSHEVGNGVDSHAARSVASGTRKVKTWLLTSVRMTAAPWGAFLSTPLLSRIAQDSWPVWRPTLYAREHNAS